MRVLIQNKKFKLRDVTGVAFISFFVFILSVFALIFNRSVCQDKIVLVEAEAEAYIIKERSKFSEELLMEFLLELNVKFPEIVLAQARLESANFQSPIFKENNNLFGMKQAKMRATTAKGTRRGHAVYDNWRESVIDYAFYQMAYLRQIKTEGEYYQYLGRSYAEDPNYVHKVKQIVERELQVVIK